MHAEILTILVAHARALAPRGTEDGALALRLNRDHLSAIHVRLLPQSADTGKQSITPVAAHMVVAETGTIHRGAMAIVTNDGQCHAVGRA